MAYRDTMERLESCNSVWLLDEVLMQFCRIPRGCDPANAVSAPWQRYYAFSDDSETGAFRVALDETRTHWLSSSRHRDPCPRCPGEVTAEVVMAPPPRAGAGDRLA